MNDNDEPVWSRSSWEETGPGVIHHLGRGNLPLPSPSCVLEYRTEW